MQARAGLLSLLLAWTVACGADQPVAPQKASDSELIARLVRQLSNEDFAARAEATHKLEELRLASRPQLEIAIKSEDTELRTRATQILSRLDGLLAQDLFLAAMKGPWQEALKEGRLIGPLLGVSGAIAQPVGTATAVKPGRDVPVKTSIAEGIEMLAALQCDDGHWRAVPPDSQVQSDVEQTAFALLAFHCAGHTERKGGHTERVRKAVSWLKNRQRPDGAICNVGWTEVDHVTHALAALVLSEASGCGHMAETKIAAQRAVDFALSQQDERSGGWGRAKGVPPDLLTTSLYVHVMEGAHIAGLRLQPTHWDGGFEGAIRFLDSLEDREKKAFRYVADGKPSPQATLLGLVSRQFLGWKSEDLTEAAVAAFKKLGEPTAGQEGSDALMNYFGTWVASNQGDIWENWKKPLRRNLIATQIPEGAFKGGWHPGGVWANGGRVLSTALNVISLQISLTLRPGEE